MRNAITTWNVKYVLDNDMMLSANFEIRVFSDNRYLSREI